MRQVGRICVAITPVADHSGEYLAHWSSEFYGATYSVHFKDTILGALALHTFAEMLRRHYDARSIDFQLTGPASGLRSPALLDLVGRTSGRASGKIT